MKTYAIMQQPGPAARRRAARYGERYVPPRRAALVVADDPQAALARFVEERYVATRNRQYGGHSIERRGGRYAKATVRLVNGVNEHDAVFVAWPREDGPR